MTNEQFQQLINLLTDIKNLLENNQQPQTKITVVGNKPQTNSVPKAKGFTATDDFTL
jgi:hypothetical protein